MAKKKASLEEMEVIDIDLIVPDDLNPNLGTPEGKLLLDKSLKELGAGRGILLDKDNRNVAGNKALAAAKAAGVRKVIVVPSDGSVLVATKRIDLTLDSKKGREMAIADNRTAEANILWDEVVMSQISANYDIDLSNDWGILTDFEKSEQAVEVTDNSNFDGAGEAPNREVTNTGGEYADYVVLEFIMHKTEKDEINEVLNRVKNEQEFDSLAESLHYVVTKIAQI